MNIAKRLTFGISGMAIMYLGIWVYLLTSAYGHDVLALLTGSGFEIAGGITLSKSLH